MGQSDLGQEKVPLANAGDPSAMDFERRVVQMLQLAERLRESSGSDLDDEAILAVSEASSIPVEYVRATLTRLPGSSKKRGLFASIRHTVLGLEPETRRYVASGLLSTNLALLSLVITNYGDQYGLIGVAAGAILLTALWNFAVSREARVALISGGLFGGLFFVSRSAFLLAAKAPETVSAALIIPHILGYGVAAFLLFFLLKLVKEQMGERNPAVHRQDLLKQMMELQEKLRSGEQTVSFLSLDVVGSTLMKQRADPLNVEYTFTEYHNWVAWAVEKFGGKVHSTAGDGIICAFDHPQMAYAAARFMQTGIVELNTFKNKLAQPLVLRAGIHYGVVNAPAGEDITKLNFASVIDIAAHMQKVAPAGGIAVSEAAASLLPGGANAVGQEQVEISNTKGWVWQPKALAIGEGSGLPALPEGA